MMSPRVGNRIAACAVVLAATLAACKTSPPGPAETLLLSQPEWEWQSACCGFAGNTLTPGTEGYDYVLQFMPRSRVRAVRNGTLVIETGYHFVRSPGGPTTDPSLTIVYDDTLPLGPGIEPAPGHLVFQLESGAILLRNVAPCADCFGDWRFLARLSR